MRLHFAVWTTVRVRAFWMRCMGVGDDSFEISEDHSTRELQRSSLECTMEVATVFAV